MSLPSSQVASLRDLTDRYSLADVLAALGTLAAQDAQEMTASGFPRWGMAMEGDARLIKAAAQSARGTRVNRGE